MYGLSAAFYNGYVNTMHMNEYDGVYPIILDHPAESQLLCHLRKQLGGPVVRA